MKYIFVLLLSVALSGCFDKKPSDFYGEYQVYAIGAVSKEKGENYIKVEDKDEETREKMEEFIYKIGKDEAIVVFPLNEETRRFPEPTYFLSDKDGVGFLNVVYENNVVVKYEVVGKKLRFYQKKSPELQLFIDLKKKK